MESVAQRFWRYVDKSAGSDGCWPWTGGRRGLGYGRFKLASYHTVSAHRLAYVIGHGEPLGELHACHHCDNPPCCNPDHLFAGTNADNMADDAALDLFTDGRPWRTYQIARRLGQPTSKVLARMRRYERAGIVERSRHTAANDISWQLKLPA